METSSFTCSDYDVEDFLAVSYPNLFLALEYIF